MVAYPFPPYLWVPGASVRLVKFLKYMSRQRPNWDIDVITAGYGNDECNMPHLADDLLTEVPQSINIFRVTDPAYAKGGRFFSPGLKIRHSTKQAIVRIMKQIPRVKHHLKKMKQTMIAKLNIDESIPDSAMRWNDAVLSWISEHSNRKFNLIYVSCPPYSTAVLGLQLKNLLCKPLIIDMKDNWASYMKHHPAERRIKEETLERQVVLSADKVILVTPASLEYYQRRYPKYQRFNLVSNGVDLVDYSDINLETTIPSIFKVTYAGSLGGSIKAIDRNPINFFRAFQRLLQNPMVDPNSCMACFPKHMAPNFWRAVAEMGLERWIKAVPILPMPEFKKHLAESCVLLSINYYEETTLVPGKLYEYWAVGRPILLIEKPGAATQLVKRYNLGLTVDPDDVDGIYLALQNFYQDYISGQRKILNRDSLYQFNREELTRKLCTIIEQCLNRGFTTENWTFNQNIRLEDS